jgi:type IV secretory pathway protease TraF
MIPRAEGGSSPVARTAMLLAALAAMVVGGCQRPPRTAGSVVPMMGRETLITEEEIVRMSVQTAWDAVRLRAPRLTFGLDAQGRPAQVRIQAQRSFAADETPLLVVDGAQVSDIEYLSQIPASDVHAIHILDAEAAEPLYGLRAAGGAIIVETKSGK